MKEKVFTAPNIGAILQSMFVRPICLKIRKLYSIICLNKQEALSLSLMEKNSCIRILADEAQINECRGKLKDTALLFAELSYVLELSANETRLKILYLLNEEKELCPCDLSDILGMSIQAISQHLRKLKDGQIIQSRREAQTIYYSLRTNHLKVLKPFFKYVDQENYIQVKS